MENEKPGRPKGSLSLRRFRCAERRWRASPLRSTAAGIGGVRSRVDSQDTLLQQRVINQKNKGHWVTPLLAQRYPLPGNSYFWRAAEGQPYMHHFSLIIRTARRNFHRLFEPLRLCVFALKQRHKVRAGDDAGTGVRGSETGTRR